MQLKIVQLSTKGKDEFKDITKEVQKAVSETGIIDGIATVFVPHTTAGITINENADPDVCIDLINQLNEMVPWKNNYRHMEGNAAAHLKAGMMGFSETVIIENGRLALGTWQGIYLTEFDGPRNRKIYVKVI